MWVRSLTAGRGLLATKPRTSSSLTTGGALIFCVSQTVCLCNDAAANGVLWCQLTSALCRGGVGLPLLPTVACVILSADAGANTLSVRLLLSRHNASSFPFHLCCFSPASPGVCCSCQTTTRRAPASTGSQVQPTGPCQGPCQHQCPHRRSRAAGRQQHAGALTQRRRQWQQTGATAAGLAAQ